MEDNLVYHQRTLTSQRFLFQKKFEKNKPHGRKLPHMAMMTSRGCPYNCIYYSKFEEDVKRMMEGKKITST